MVQELGEDPTLGGQRDILAPSLLRGAVPGEVEGVDGHRLGQGGDDLAPDVGGEGGAVHQHERGSCSEHLVAHRALGRSVLPDKRPSIHRPLAPFSPTPTLYVVYGRSCLARVAWRGFLARSRRPPES